MGHVPCGRTVQSGPRDYEIGEDEEDENDEFNEANYEFDEGDE